MKLAEFPREVREDLEKSGLSDVTIAENGIRMIPPADIPKFEPHHASRVRFAIEFPYHNLKSEEPFSRVKLYPPVVLKDGSKKKYTQPAGSENHLYFPKSVPIEALQDVTTPIVIVEGEKKVLKAVQDGIGIAIGVSGVWSWQKKGAPIRDLDVIAWEGRRSLVCFDSDTWRPGKDQMRRALYALGRELELRGASVEFVILPDGSDGEKVGLDDFLLARPAEAFFSLPLTSVSDSKHFKGMRSWWNTWKKDHSKKMDVDWHEGMAQHVFEVNAETPIIYIQGDGFYRYASEGFYRSLSKELLSVEIRRGIRSFEKALGFEEPIEARRTLRAEVEDAMRDILLIQQPDLAINKATEVLNIQNGLLNLATMQLSPHTPKAYFTTQLQAKYDPAAECPLWIKTLSDIFARDSSDARAEKIEALRRFFGLCLVPDQSFQKILVLIGEGANGKSLILSVLQAILGIGNYSSVSIDQLSNNFYICELQNKLANISSEINSKNPVSDSMLKRLSGEDSIAADRKNQQPIKFFSFARLIFSMNEVPLIEDRSHAFYRRLVVVEFTRTFREDEQRRDLRDRLLEERNGIFRWMLGGLLDLKKEGRFQDSDTMRRAVLDFRRENNPVLAFAEQWLEESELGQLTKGAVYMAYKEWCERNGKRPFAANKFSSLLQKSVYGIEDGRIGGGTRVWNGVAFSGEVDQDSQKRFSLLGGGSW